MRLDAPVVGPPTDDRPHRPVLWRWVVVVAASFVAIVAAGTVALVTAGGEVDEDAAHVAPAGPLDLGSVPDAIAVHYRYAEAHEAEFSAIPCFCGCEQFLAHRHLYDCFVRADGTGYDRHAAGCGVCIGEATVAAELLDQGTATAEVAERIIEQFGSTPTTAPDETVPRGT